MLLGLVLISVTKNGGGREQGQGGGRGPAGLLSPHFHPDFLEIPQKIRFLSPFPLSASPPAFVCCCLMFLKLDLREFGPSSAWSVVGKVLPFSLLIKPITRSSIFSFPKSTCFLLPLRFPFPPTFCSDQGTNEASSTCEFLRKLPTISLPRNFSDDEREDRGRRV